jgi:hypothetical protein
MERECKNLEFGRELNKAHVSIFEKEIQIEIHCDGVIVFVIQERRV